MEIKVWYSNKMKQWRWSLLDIHTRQQESGQQYHIRDAMSDIATTIEYLVDKHEYEGQD
tara:strand:- start:22 stop:198 length:177 start_codon:yes stop_codon:yes gene_type:complete